MKTLKMVAALTALRPVCYIYFGLMEYGSNIAGGLECLT